MREKRKRAREGKGGGEREGEREGARGVEDEERIKDEIQKERGGEEEKM